MVADVTLDAQWAGLVYKPLPPFQGFATPSAARAVLLRVGLVLDCILAWFSYVFPDSQIRRNVHAAVCEAFPELQGHSFEDVVLLLLEVGVRLRQSPGRIQFAEFFAGTAWVARGVARVGWACRALDAKYLPSHNILSRDGLRVWLLSTLDISRGGCQWLAPVCSSWVWLCRKQSGRSRSNPHGHSWKAFVQVGNRMLELVLFQALLGFSLGVDYVIETPMSSLLCFLPEFLRFTEVTSSIRITTWLGNFGALSQKGLKLWSSAAWATQLRSKRPKRRMVPLVKRSGRRVTGLKARLADSEHYPPAFGEAVARAIAA